ncbi:hypothetical protein OVA24_16555 [Luteolibacter sp. SL250]|uniref:hypothetical protein n=1 Tax=Luteolibacter sp. SL250 TaxID=2995170 RepID=UPI0022703DAE|nr:hypothetical protein [Luteolibacter sp. SL250]WAC18843.1 hypothetical protein OVA24_16555 [Luteolibacter sp. SL250]
MPAAKKTASRSARKAPAAAPQKKRGNLTGKEIKPLVIQARKAYDVQTGMDLTDGLSFDDWRREQVLACVGKKGLTACHHDDFRPLLAHFQTLAGDDTAALANLLKSGHQTDNADPGDTQEARRQLAYLIATALAEHMYLAMTSAEQLRAEAIEFHNLREEQEGIPADQRIPWEASPGPAALRIRLERKAAIEVRGKGPLTPGYLIAIVRQKTRRPNLQLGQMWQDGLAERCTVEQLRQILFTLTNRINAVEGVQETEAGRNKAQRSGKYRAAKKAAQETPRW